MELENEPGSGSKTPEGSVANAGGLKELREKTGSSGADTGGGIGARSDKSPLPFFQLRSINYQELLRLSIESRLESMLKNADKKTDRSLTEDDVHDLFGI